MSILLPLLMALAAAHPNDRLFDAPADYESLEPHEGQPVWVLMAGCAKANYQEVEDLQNMPVTATETAVAERYGMTVEEAREADIAGLTEGMERFLTIAIEGMAVDRGVSIEEAREFIRAQMAEVEPVEPDIWGGPCIGIADAIQPPAA
jgi:hypothetical protein